MAFTQSLSLLHTPLFLSPKTTNPKLPPLFTKLPFPSLRTSFPISSRTIPNAQNDGVLDAVANNKALPGVRTFENELTRLTVVGAVDFNQALTAAAADGGEAADEHIESGSAAMVVETLFPGVGDDRSTVSTRLFLPASKVKEKAKKLKKILNDDLLSSTSSQNILAMTFRQVVLEQLWNYELVIFRPGTKRNTEHLLKPREVPASFTLSSSDELPISVLAEVVCLAALDSTERQFRDKSIGSVSANIYNFFRKPKRISSKDMSVIIHMLVEDDLVKNADNLLEKFNLEKANHKLTNVNPNYNWWTLSAFSELTKIGGPEFSTWVSEYVPAYKLQIDNNKVRNIKFEGWKNTSDNRWEVLLTHSQMVGLANILDMYYEDLYTLPNKELSCGVITKATDFSISKRRMSFLKILSTVVVSALALVTISTMGQLRLPNMRNGRIYPGDHQLHKASDTKSVRQQSVDSAKSEDFATSIVATVKETYGWPGDIMKQGDGAAWIGELPEYLRSMVEADYLGVDFTSAASSEKNDDEMNALAQDIASYQVVLSAEGKIIGIQPTSTVAVNHWVTNPLAQELYVGRNLSPGLPDPRPETIGPTEMVVLEFLIPVNPGSCFAIARPIKL